MREEFQRRGPLYINGVYAGRAQAAFKNVERFDERWAISEIAHLGLLTEKYNHSRHAHRSRTNVRRCCEAYTQLTRTDLILQQGKGHGTIFFV